MNEMLPPTAQEIADFKVIVTMNARGMKTSVFLQHNHSRDDINKILRGNVAEDVEKLIASGTLSKDFAERVMQDTRCKNMLKCAVNEIVDCQISFKKNS